MKGDASHIRQRTENIQFWFVWEHVFVFDAQTQNRIYKTI